MMQAFLFFLGLCSGGIIAAGLFSFIVSIGVISRVIDKTHTENHIRLFEMFLAAGATAGNLLNLYQLSMYHWISHPVSMIYLCVQGITAGIFVGVLVMALAETLNALPIFCRNLHMMKGLKYVILFLALGKGTGAILDFMISAAG